LSFSTRLQFFSVEQLEQFFATGFYAFHAVKAFPVDVHVTAAAIEFDVKAF
jgi:hypothetical protein